MGHVISKEGLSPDGEKIHAIRQMPRAIDSLGVQRLLGVVYYRT